MEHTRAGAGPAILVLAAGGGERAVLAGDTLALVGGAARTRGAALVLARVGRIRVGGGDVREAGVAGKAVAGLLVGWGAAHNAAHRVGNAVAVCECE